MLKFFILTLIISSTLSYSIPPYVHLCKRNDPELDKCFVNTINEIRPYLKEGIPELNLPPIEPFKIESLKFNAKSANGNINIEVLDGIMENASSFVVKSFAIDLNKGFFDSQVIFKNLKFNSKYRFKGKLMLFNIDSEGDLKMDIGELTANAQWYASPYTKDNKEYFKFDYANVTTLSRGFKIQFENVFKDKALSDNFNAVVNANIDALAPEFGPIVDQTVNSLTLECLNDIYSVFPLDVLYPND